MPSSPLLNGPRPAVSRLKTEAPSAASCAEEILDVIPAVMGSLRHELRRDRTSSITFVQFRVLSFLNRQERSSLSGVAEHLELGLPATSKILDGLVGSAFVRRMTDPADRRRILLQLTATGLRELQATRSHSRRHLAAMLSPLTAEEQGDITHAMHILRSLFAERSCKAPPPTVSPAK